jgi:hypothetical protein
MSNKNCDNFGDFFVYRLENILTKKLRKTDNKILVSKVIKDNEDVIKNEFNFYLDAKIKAVTPEKRSKVFTLLLESWRPVMMYIFMYIISQYYIINPVVEFLVPGLKLKDLPPEMWTLLTVAVGGYITSRGVEKGIKIWKGTDNTPQPIIMGTASNPENNINRIEEEMIDEDVNLKEEDLS